MTEKNVNVAIFGSGLAGLAAAVNLLEKGVKDVVVFEKRPFQGGAISNTPMCFMSVKNDRRFQDKAFREHCKYTSFDGNMATARAWLNNSWRIPQYIQDLGLGFEMHVETPYEEIGNNDGYTGGFPFGMNLGDYYILKARGKGHGGALVCLRAAQKIRRLGGEIIFNTSLQELIREEGGSVTGAVVKEKNGETYSVKANDIIVATGGIGNAASEMIKEETGYIYTDREGSNGGNAFCNSFFNDQLTGDGCKAIWRVGGEKTKFLGAGRNVGYPGIVNYVPWIVRNQILTIQEQPYLVVNRLGERFIDEGENRRSANIATAMKNQPGRTAYLIFDENTMHSLETKGTEYFYMIFPATIIQNGKEQFRELIEEQGSRQVFMAESLEELADKTGIDKSNLLKTVDRYNELCDKKYDEDFGKNPDYLQPCRKGTFYCIKMMNVNYDFIGGVNIDRHGKVLDKDHKVIPHLYAAGDTASGCVYGPSTPNVTSVSSISYVTGMICADTIAGEQEE